VVQGAGRKGGRPGGCADAITAGAAQGSAGDGAGCGGPAGGVPEQHPGASSQGVPAPCMCSYTECLSSLNETRANACTRVCMLHSAPCTHAGTALHWLEYSVCYRVRGVFCVHEKHLLAPLTFQIQSPPGTPSQVSPKKNPWRSMTDLQTHNTCHTSTPALPANAVQTLTNVCSTDAHDNRDTLQPHRGIGRTCRHGAAPSIAAMSTPAAATNAGCASSHCKVQTHHPLFKSNSATHGTLRLSSLCNTTRCQPTRA
jgi:hypothetical protein